MAEFTFKVKGGREDFRRTSVILLNSGASHPKVADDGTVTVRADRGNPFAGIAAQLRNESVKAFFKCDTVKVAGIRNQAGAAEIVRSLLRVPGVVSATADCTTGLVTLTETEGTDREAILSELVKAGCREVSDDPMTLKKRLWGMFSRKAAVSPKPVSSPE